MPSRLACVIEDIGENKRRQGMASTVEDTDLFLECYVACRHGLIYVRNYLELRRKIGIREGVRFEISVG